MNKYAVVLTTGVVIYPVLVLIMTYKSSNNGWISLQVFILSFIKGCNYKDEYTTFNGEHLHFVSQSKTFKSSGICLLLGCISGLIGQWNWFGGGELIYPEEPEKLYNELVSRVADAFICVKTEVTIGLEPTVNGTI